MTNKPIEALHPDIRCLVKARVNSHINFIKEHDRSKYRNLLLGNPAEAVVTAMRAELKFWGIDNV